MTAEQYKEASPIVSEITSLEDFIKKKPNYIPENFSINYIWRHETNGAIHTVAVRFAEERIKHLAEKLELIGNKPTNEKTTCL